MRILGIESSCDETAAAVVEDGRHVLSSIVASQLDLHARYGGVVPELASREHLRAIIPVVREALGRAQCNWTGLDAIAVTEGPGLVGSLLVGVTYAKGLCYALGLPLIAVNHVEGHIHAVVMESYPVPLPAVALVVSGGHTHLFLVEMDQTFRYRLLGRTRDDAAGEAYDKVAKLLGYGYPGGPVLDALAAHGDPHAVRFTPAKMKGNTLDFSFSGLKTAVLRWVEQRGIAHEIAHRRTLQRPTLDDWLAATPPETLGLIASFQQSVIGELLSRTTRAVEQTGAESVIVSGGVACNSGLRRASNAVPASVFFPTPSLSTDNAAMIAAAAFPKLQQKAFAGWDLRAKANLSLT